MFFPKKKQDGFWCIRICSYRSGNGLVLRLSQLRKHVGVGIAILCNLERMAVIEVSEFSGGGCF